MKTARRRCVSRSQDHAKTTSECLDLQQAEPVTKRLDEIYSRLPAKVDPALHRAQIESLAKDFR